MYHLPDHILLYCNILSGREKERGVGGIERNSVCVNIYTNHTHSALLSSTPTVLILHATVNYTTAIGDIELYMSLYISSRLR